MLVPERAPACTLNVSTGLETSTNNLIKKSKPPELKTASDTTIHHQQHSKLVGIWFHSQQSATKLRRRKVEKSTNTRSLVPWTISLIFICNKYKMKNLPPGLPPAHVRAVFGGPSNTCVSRVGRRDRNNYWQRFRSRSLRTFFFVRCFLLLLHQKSCCVQELTFTRSRDSAAPVACTTYTWITSRTSGSRTAHPLPPR